MQDVPRKASRIAATWNKKNVTDNIEEHSGFFSNVINVFCMCKFGFEIVFLILLSLFFLDTIDNLIV